VSAGEQLISHPSERAKPGGTLVHHPTNKSAPELLKLPDGVVVQKVGAKHQTTENREEHFEPQDYIVT
jgi:hypothetical protein